MDDEKKQKFKDYDPFPDEQLIQRLLNLMSPTARRAVIKLRDVPGHENEMLVIDMKWEKDDMIDPPSQTPHKLN